ncbi:hypothetical protein SPF06_15905 [Sinomonas sp. JGH33]|uniref:CcmD family protein n=1 Tax=Sinomonas terricola TaxID=3110330 RepID=A0ABU5T9U4_9MICC|nr:hypothetical protein [Sinomonas sp. JGH33]MEA5456221.1 hypothetical protein [Sinomonas sp. JGH33]
MHSLLLAFMASGAMTPDPTPAGTLKPGLTEDQVSPGLWGFLATAFVVVLSVFIIVDMVRRLRRVRYRSQVEEERERREAEAHGAGEPAAGDVEHDGGEQDGGDTPSSDGHEGRAANGAGNGAAG